MVLAGGDTALLLELVEHVPDAFVVLVAAIVWMLRHVAVLAG